MSDEKVLSPKNEIQPSNGRSINGHDVNKILFWFCLLWNVVYLTGTIISFFNPEYHVPHAATVIYLSLVGS